MCAVATDEDDYAISQLYNLQVGLPHAQLEPSVNATPPPPPIPRTLAATPLLEL